MRSLICLGVAGVCAMGLAACGPQAKGGTRAVSTLGNGDDTRSKLRSDKNDDKSKTRYLAIQTKRKSGGADAFVWTAYPLGGAWQVEVTCGLYKEKKADNLGDGFFGLEVRRFDASDEMYAVYGRYDEANDRIIAFAVTHDGVQGADLPLNSLKMAAVIVSDGTNVTLGARIGEAPAGFLTIATVPLASPAELHEAGFGAFDMGDGSLVGFTNLTVPQNAFPAAKNPAGKAPRERAVDHLKEGLRLSANGFSLVNRGVPNSTTLQNASFELFRAQDQFFFGGEALLGLPPSKTRDKAEKLFGALGGDVGFAGVQLDGRHEAKKAGKRAAKVILEHVPRKSDQLSRLLDQL